MKQYRLLKDLPITLAGTIFYPKEENSSVYKPKNGGWLEEVPEELVTGCPHFFEEVNTVEKESDIVLEMRGSHDGIEHRDSRTHFKKKNRFDGRRLSKLEIKANLSCQEDCKDLIDILEIHKFCFPNPEPSSKKEEGWEILSVIGKSTGFIYKKRQGEFSYKEGYLDIKLSQVLDGNVVSGCEIHSVLRKSDNTVFTVGDETTIGVIKRFEVSEELMYWWNEHTWYYLSQAIKAPTNTVEDKPFVWTDVMVKDFYKYCYNNVFKRPTSPEEMIEEFKKSKTNNQ